MQNLTTQNELPHKKVAGVFMALSRFVIANDMKNEVRKAFLERPHLVDDAPGFISMDVVSPMDNPDEIWLLTYWEDESSYKNWHRGHLYQQSHKGIPKGLKLVPKSASVRLFEYISS